jgi:murein DD-endopeptidase MepM/ murein hydrolase activator NlpD
VLPRTRRHTVKTGESGFDIAYQYGVPFSAIAIANGLDKDARVKAGQKLLIPTLLHPSPDGVIGGNNADKADNTPATKAADKADTSADTATVKFVWPVEGSVRRGFATRGSKSYHDGMDIIAKPDTAVRAAAAGTVIFAGDEPQSFGRLVVLDHGGGWQSAYGFLGKMTVKKGETDELHFELRQANKPVDPAELLPAKAVEKAKIAPKAKADSKVKAKKPDKG